MSTDGVDTEPATEPERWLPSRTALWEGFLTVWYFTLLVIGITMLVTLELVGRL